MKPAWAVHRLIILYFFMRASHIHIHYHTKGEHTYDDDDVEKKNSNDRNEHFLIGRFKKKMKKNCS